MDAEFNAVANVPLIQLKELGCFDKGIDSNKLTLETRSGERFDGRDFRCKNCNRYNSPTGSDIHLRRLLTEKNEVNLMLRSFVSFVLSLSLMTGPAMSQTRVALLSAISSISFPPESMHQSRPDSRILPRGLRVGVGGMRQLRQTSSRF